MSEFRIGEAVTAKEYPGLDGVVINIKPDKPWFQVRLDYDGSVSWCPDDRFRQRQRNNIKE